MGKSYIVMILDKYYGCWYVFLTTGCRVNFLFLFLLFWFALFSFGLDKISFDFVSAEGLGLGKFTDITIKQSFSSEIHDENWRILMKYFWLAVICRFLFGILKIYPIQLSLLNIFIKPWVDQWNNVKQV